MRYFIDTGLTRDIPLGPCIHPDKPHEQETATIRSEFTSDEINALSVSGLKAIAREYVRVAIVSWTLPMKLTPQSYILLRPDIQAIFLTEIGKSIGASLSEAITGEGDADPPPSAVRSRRTTRTNGSQGQTHPRAV